MYRFLLLLLLCAACTNRNTDQQSGVNTDVHAGADPVTPFAEGKPMVLDGCYEMTLQRDTARLTLSVQDTLVQGTLAYYWAERDQNRGTLQGVLRDSLIIAAYTFSSEGRQSVREVVFRVQDSVLVEGFGDLREEGQRVVFRNRDSLQYMNDHPFVKVPCPR